MAALKLSSSAEVLAFLEELQERVEKLEKALAQKPAKAKKESRFFGFDDEKEESEKRHDRGKHDCSPYRLPYRR
jgi:hypothetical protein